MIAYSKVCDYDPVAYREYVAAYREGLRVSICKVLNYGGDGVDVRSPGGVFDLRLGGFEGVGRQDGHGGGVRCGAVPAAGQNDGACRSAQGVGAQDEACGDASSQAGYSSPSGAASGGSVGAGKGDSRCGRDVESGVSDGVAEAVGGVTAEEHGKHWKKNQKKREKQKCMKQQWRSQRRTGEECSSSCSAGGSAQTVDTRTGVEIEAAQTLAARRVAENKLKIVEAEVAAKLAEHRLKALNDKARSLVIDRLAAARLEEKINTSKKKSQDSFKGCDSPIESVGSALSAHEFAFKQQVRKIEAQKVENKYKDEQLKKFYQYATPDVRQMVAEIPEPYIPTDEEMEAEDLDQSPEPTDEEMEAEAARYFS